MNFCYAFYALHYNTENNNVSLPTKYQFRCLSGRNTKLKEDADFLCITIHEIM